MLAAKCGLKKKERKSYFPTGPRSLELGKDYILVSINVMEGEERDRWRA